MIESLWLDGCHGSDIIVKFESVVKYGFAD